jgi:hypothetical protein
VKRQFLLCSAVVSAVYDTRTLDSERIQRGYAGVGVDNILESYFKRIRG